MQLGISSMQRVANYGSFLQAHGLKESLKTFGHNVQFVDYAPGRVVAPLTERVKISIKHSLRIATSRLAGVGAFRNVITPTQSAKARFEADYRELYLPLLGVTSSKQAGNGTELLVVGSDEVFNCLQRNKNVGFSEDLLGGSKFRQISYAASFGNTTLGELRTAGVDGRLAGLLKNFEAISVRDENSATIVSELTGKKPEVNIDPVLLHGFQKQEFAHSPQDRPSYAIVYAYPKRLGPSEINQIRAYADRRNVKLVAVGGYYDFCDDYVACSPFEIPNLFAGAEFIVTDTFHGTIFSMLSHKPFATFVRPGHGRTYGNSEKVSHLLDMFQFESKTIHDVSSLAQVIESPTDFSNFEAILATKRQESVRYLSEALRP